MLRTYRTSELVRGMFVLRLCRHQKFVENSEKLMNVSKKFLGQRLFAWLMKRTFYGQFVAGEDIVSMRETVKRLNDSNVCTMFYVPVESDEGGDNSDHQRSALLDGNLKLFLEGITEAYMTHYMQTSQLHPADNQQALVEAGQDLNSLVHIPTPVLDKHLDRAAELSKRLCSLIEHGRQSNVVIMFDAEQTYFQPAIQRLILPYQIHYNRIGESPLVYTTLQAYLKETVDVLDSCLSLLRQEKVHFATKLVRGAYMQQERKRAGSLGYPSPILDTYEDTNASYEHCLRQLLDGVGDGVVSVMVSTHNSANIEFAKERMQAMGLANSDGHRVCFGQIYGLGDKLTSMLAQEGYQVYKSVPYGPVDTVLAYLSRRAQENHSVLNRAKQESAFLWEELQRRMRSRS